MIISQKELFDKKIIDSALKKILKTKQKNCKHTSFMLVLIIAVLIFVAVLVII